ncbi:hypothetical protein IU443_11185 [Nocardia farcinica]|uniref:DUF8175 domain-containing protein n=1 Tax=Nocardia farcinica (strain IFM 10152) TaxID=247156 RepID=Q5YTG8_NOCFA|nr:hypothetical protein [Nocardia farcinica]MBF6068746.1 hypothetical protein [Nocardia farcinica]MBF6139506.1 hypothetical protein [Nocardia farcinica]MBF6229885.1 hypothetical protein [Nocardia farcinica]MBF6250475.1 hypothetical protein [Nocardia farcinica]MBF6256707.1 hypothetical protein [Nocardia farcinica]
MSQKEPYARDRVSFGAVASAALLALIVIAGVVVYITRDDDAPEGAQAELAATVGEGFATPEVDIFGRRVDIPNNPAGQPLPQDPTLQRTPEDADWLTARPDGLDRPHGWQRVYGASVPFSTSDGPARLEEGQAVGYAHTPQGAVLAAAQITYRLNARPADRELYVRQVRVSAQQLAAYDRALEEDRLPEQQPERITRYFVAPDAFQVESYADDLAVVRFASRAPAVDGRQLWVALRLVMVWEAGDWRLKPATAEGSRTEYIESLAGWTTW